MCLLDDRVVRVAPMTAREAVRFADAFHKAHFPDLLKQPTPLSMPKLADEVLPLLGIDVYSSSELVSRNSHGETVLGNDRIEILLAPSLFDDLYGGRQELFARATLAHEASHALVHIPQILRQLKERRGCVLQRVQRRQIPAYEDPEWQAWMVGGALLMPLEALRACSGRTYKEIASMFRVSAQMASSHIQRLRRCGIL